MTELIHVNHPQLASFRACSFGRSYSQMFHKISVIKRQEKFTEKQPGPPA